MASSSNSYVRSSMTFVLLPRRRLNSTATITPGTEADTTHRPCDMTDSRSRLHLCKSYVSAERGANDRRLISANGPMDAWSDGRRDADEYKRMGNWPHLDWTTTGTTEWTTTSGKEDHSKWRSNAARAASIAGLRMPEKERRGLDLTIDSYNGQDVNVHENDCVAQVRFTTLRTKIPWMARTCWKEDAEADV